MGFAAARNETRSIATPRRRQSPLFRLVGNGLTALGVLLLTYSVLFYGYALYQQVASGLRVPGMGLPSLVGREEPALSAAAPAPPPVRMPAFGSPPTHIEIPSIDVDAPVVEIGTTYDQSGQLVWETADHAVGHHTGTASPGDPTGNVVLSGHISSPVRKQGNVFSQLPYLKVGEEVLLTTEQGTYRYRVDTRKVVEPTEVDVLNPTADPTLTLITCYPDLIYSHRLVVTATLTGVSPL